MKWEIAHVSKKGIGRVGGSDLPLEPLDMNQLRNIIRAENRRDTAF